MSLAQVAEHPGNKVRAVDEIYPEMLKPLCLDSRPLTEGYLIISHVEVVKLFVFCCSVKFVFSEILLLLGLAER